MFERYKKYNILNRHRYRYDILERLENGNFLWVGYGVTESISALEWDFIKFLAKKKGFLYQIRQEWDEYEEDN